MIGIFDSGLGGLSVWKEVVNYLPKETIIYVADSGNCPYGSKPKKEVQVLSENITKFLLKKGCTMIIVACNTATTAAIEYLRANYEVPFIGIEPAIKPAAEKTQTGTIGILATKGTLEGELFKKTKQRYANHLNVVMQVGKGLVEIVEHDLLEEPDSYKLVQQYIDPMLKANADQIVLGCTHYPFLEGLIDKITQNKAKIINPAPAVARQAKRILEQKKLSDTTILIPKYSFYTSGDVQILSDFLHKNIKLNFEENVLVEFLS